MFVVCIGMETSTCNHCKQSYTEKSWYTKQAKKRKRKLQFCCRECHRSYFDTTFKTCCGNCGKEILKTLKDKNKNSLGNYYCSRSCAVIANNKIRKKKRRSKIEKALFEMIQKAFPKLVILSNDREALQGLELDIYIPELKLGIEWNGIVHFKPIYGMEKLLAVQEKDRQKMEIANAKNIHLIVIPDHESKYSLVKESFSKIKEIIEKLLST